MLRGVVHFGSFWFILVHFVAKSWSFKTFGPPVFVHTYRVSFDLRIKFGDLNRRFRFGRYDTPEIGTTDDKYLVAVVLLCYPFWDPHTHTHY